MTVVFTPLPLEERGDLAKLVAEHCEVLEEGLKIVKRGAEDTRWGPLDLLAVDKHRRLVIITVTPQHGDQLLLEGLAHVGWFFRNRQRIAGPLSEQGADPALYPRLILIAGDFSTTLQDAMEGLRNMAVDLFRYRWLEAAEQKGILLEPVISSAVKEETKMELETSPASLAEGVVPLAEEEIEAFMKMDPRFTI